MLTIKHRFDRACATDTIIMLVMELWSRMHSQDGGDIVTCVVPDHEDVDVLGNGIKATALALDDTCGDEIHVMSAEGTTTWDSVKGHIFLVTYGQLRTMLAQTQPKVGVSIILCLGAGEYTLDVVSACLALHRWAEDADQDDQYYIYTLSTTRKSIYKCAQDMCPVRRGVNDEDTQPWHIDIPTFCQRVTELVQEGIEFTTRDAQYESDVVHNMMMEDEGHPREGPEPEAPSIGRRAAIFASTTVLKRATEGLTLPNDAVSRLAAGGLQGAWNSLLGPFAKKNMLQIELGVGCVPKVYNLDMIFVLSTKSALVLDDSGKFMAWRLETPISQSEVRYATRLRSQLHVHPMVALVSPQQGAIDALPEDPETSPAFTGGLAPLLLHLHEHPRERVTRASLPIRIPVVDSVLHWYTTRLVNQELLCSSGPNAHQMTPLGRLVETLRTQHSIGNLSAACLLAFALSQTSPIEGRQGVRMALIMHLASVVMASDESSGSPISDFVKFLYRDDVDIDVFHKELEMEARGPLSHLAKRGPIWAAVAIWRTLEKTLAPWMDEILENAEKDPVLTWCNDALRIRIKVIGFFRENLKKMQQAVTAIAGAPCTDVLHVPDDEDLWFIEGAMLRAWANNVASVPINTDVEVPFAHDIASSIPLVRSDADFVDWDLFEMSQEGASGSTVAAIYTHLDQYEDSNGSYIVPRDLTFISRPRGSVRVSIEYPEAAIDQPRVMKGGQSITGQGVDIK